MQNLIALECRKEGAPGWEQLLFSMVHTTGARLNEMLGFAASFSPRPDGSLLPQILVENLFALPSKKRTLYKCACVRSSTFGAHTRMLSEHPPLTTALKLFHTVC